MTTPHLDGHLITGLLVQSLHDRGHHFYVCDNEITLNDKCWERRSESIRVSEDGRHITWSGTYDDPFQPGNDAAATRLESFCELWNRSLLRPTFDGDRYGWAADVEVSDIPRAEQVDVLVGWIGIEEEYLGGIARNFISHTGADDEFIAEQMRSIDRSILDHISRSTHAALVLQNWHHWRSLRGDRA